VGGAPAESAEPDAAALADEPGPGGAPAEPAEPDAAARESLARADAEEES
jgi:hypothetical protein